MKLACTCLIPVWNEGDRLQRTVAQLRFAKNIDRFVVVDDGSTDGSIDHFAEENPDIAFIRMKRNQGKSEAVRVGLKRISSPIVLLYDADVRKMSTGDIDKGIETMKNDRDLKMVIFQRLHSPPIIRLLREDIILSGERVIDTKLLKLVMTTPPIPNRFDMEVALNQYCMDHGVKVRAFPTSTTNTYKIMKFGLFKGLYEDVMSMVRVAHFVGWKNYLRQLRNFCRDRIQ